MLRLEITSVDVAHKGDKNEEDDKEQVINVTI